MQEDTSSKLDTARTAGTMQSLADTGTQLMIALAHERGARMAAEAQLAEARAEIAQLKEANDQAGKSTPRPPQPK